MKKNPQNLKYKKYFKTKFKERNNFNTKLSLLRNRFSSQAKYAGIVTPEQIEAGRVSIKRNLTKRRKKVKIWIRLFPYASYTRKSVGMRMGKGKGVRAGWFAPISKGNMLYELKVKLKNRFWFFRLIKSYKTSWKKLAIPTRLCYKFY